MIGKLKGVVDSVEEEGLILDVNGVGYLVAASTRTLGAIPAVGATAELLIETYVREDAIRLFGFLTAGERDWFRLLQSVQGVGAKVALGILGALSAEALSTAVARQDKAELLCYCHAVDVDAPGTDAVTAPASVPGVTGR